MRMRWVSIVSKESEQTHWDWKAGSRIIGIGCVDDDFAGEQGAEGEQKGFVTKH
jgi:hypothetical protein